LRVDPNVTQGQVDPSQPGAIQVTVDGGSTVVLPPGAPVPTFAPGVPPPGGGGAPPASAPPDAGLYAYLPTDGGGVVDGGPADGGADGGPADAGASPPYAPR
jgi:hypothetical protein